MNISAGTIGRLAALLIALGLTGSTVFLDVDQLTEISTLAFTVIASLWAYWKDNDVTEGARIRKELIEELLKEMEE